MPSRRTHQKSRLGCLQCKRRRVKCDEQRPLCSSCTARGVRCEYATSGSLIWPKQPQASLVTADALAAAAADADSAAAIKASTATVAAASTPSISSIASTTTAATNNNATDTARQREMREAEFALSSLRVFGRLVGSSEVMGILPVSTPNVRELELMYQYCTSTCHSVSRDETTLHLWQVVMPREAVSHPFLMHGILAISALHLSRINYRSRADMYLSAAIAHHDQSVALLAPIIRRAGGMDATNGKAVFALACMMSSLPFGFFPRSPAATALTAVDDIFQAFEMTRGLAFVLGAAREWIINTEFEYMLQPLHGVPFLPDDVSEILQQLRNRNKALEAVDPHHQTDVYEHTIFQLQCMMEKIYGGCLRVALAVLWPMKVPEKYMGLLGKHEPMALVMLAHFCVILHSVTQTWYIEGCSSRILRSVWMSLTPEWRQDILWPLKITGTTVPM